MPPNRIEEIERPVRVDREVRVRLGRRPVMRRLSSSVNDQLKGSRIASNQAVDRLGVTYLEVEGPELVRVGLDQKLGLRRCRGARTEEVRTHIVFDTYDVEASLDEVPNRFGA